MKIKSILIFVFVFCYTFACYLKEKVSNFKYSFKKLVFILPMLALMLALYSFAPSQNSLSLETQTNVSTFDHKQSPTFTSTDIVDKDLVYNESEKTEFEIELNFFHDYSFQDNFLELKYNSGIDSNTYNFHKSNQKLPLYDLFCNWKLHIS